MQRRNSYYFLLLVLALAVIAVAGVFQLKTVLGLDITGGIRMTYQVSVRPEEKTRNIQMETARQQIIDVLLNRASGLAAEPVVSAKGDDQIVVEIPGVNNPAEAEAMIGSSARIQLYHARNVISGQDMNRQYRPEGRGEDPNKPEVKFQDTKTQKEILPGSPEYKMMIAGWYEILSGTDVESAKQDPKNSTDYIPSMKFSNEGTRKMSGWSHMYAGKEEPIAIVLDGKVLSIANVQKEAILEGGCVIEGTFTPEYVRNLVNLVNGGSLPADLVSLGSNAVSPTIGQDAYNKILLAGGIAFVLISIYLMVYYAFPGIIAFLALMLYTGLTLTVLKFIGATFSLAGIAGFILSVGMAVDANILVFERVKEEMKNGKQLLSAIEIGFKRALPAIIDSNACTILTCVVLASIGSGPVKGFATTLIIGVLVSLFTAVTVTRSLLIFFVGSGIGNDKKYFAINRDWFGGFIKDGEHIMPILQKTKLWFAISVITILIGMVFWPMGGFKLNVELQGGTEATYGIVGEKTNNEIVESLEKNGMKGSTVKFATNEKGKTAIISVPREIFAAEDDAALKDPKNNKVDLNVRSQKIAQAAGIPDAKSEGITTVGPTLQKEVQMSAVKGVILSIILIVVYLALRFGFSVGGFKEGLKFGLSAIGALFHDILVVFFMAALFGFFFKWDISSLFLTAMLTIIGFSVHDTIVIFDRIRENLHHPEAGEDLQHLMNRSITQSFSRSINTSGTVVLTLMILVFFGTPSPDLKFFVVTMLIGILSGTYSSIYNASPILYLWDKAIVAKKGEKAGLIGLAKAENVKMAHIRAGNVQTVPRATTNTAEGGRSYGQVRRRAKDAVKDSWKEID